MPRAEEVIAGLSRIFAAGEKAYWVCPLIDEPTELEKATGALDLAAAERKLDSDPDAARRLLAEARDQASDALEELRALSRGFAPPILLDRGLVAALDSAAARSVIPARVEGTLPADRALSPELERNAYFIAHEALSNAVKHSEAREIVIEVGRAEEDALLRTIARLDGVSFP